MPYLRLVSTAIAMAGLLTLPAIAQPQQRPQGPPPLAPQAQPRPPAQQQPPGKPQAQPQQQPQPAPPGPYQVIKVSAPTANNDPGLAAFRKELAAIVGRKDRNALAKMVAQTFFWMKDEGDAANKKKPAIDNLFAALNLGAKDGSGWQTLGEYAADDTAAPMPEKQGVVCSPAGPVFDEAALEKVAQATGTEAGDWGYTTQEGVEVRAQANKTAPVVEKLGVHFVRVMVDNAPNASEEWFRIVTPSGKVGFVASDAVSPLGSDQLCFAKDAAGAWKIAGFLGGGQ